MPVEWKPYVVYDKGHDLTDESKEYQGPKGLDLFDAPPTQVRMDPRVAKLCKDHQVLGIRFVVKHLIEVCPCPFFPQCPCSPVAPKHPDRSHMGVAAAPPVRSTQLSV